MHEICVYMYIYNFSSLTFNYFSLKCRLNGDSIFINNVNYFKLMLVCTETQ